MTVSASVGLLSTYDDPHFIVASGRQSLIEYSYKTYLSLLHSLTASFHIVRKKLCVSVSISACVLVGNYLNSSFFHS